MVVHVLILDKKQNSNNNLKNKDGKCFQYAAPFALNYEKKIKWNPERVSNIKPFIN